MTSQTSINTCGNLLAHEFEDHRKSYLTLLHPGAQVKTSFFYIFISFCTLIRFAATKYGLVSHGIQCGFWATCSEPGTADKRGLWLSRAG